MNLNRCLYNLVAIAAVAASTSTSSLAGSKPNIVYFLVDDLGNANVGFHNDEPLTKNIDILHGEGIELTSFYAYKFCSPTRSSINSGRLPIHVNQQNHPPNVPGGGVPLGMTMLAEKLKSAGYISHQIGKWHCGMSGRDRLPVSRGFNSSFGYLSGAEDHYLQTRDGQVDMWRDNAPAYGENGTEYNTFSYTREMVSIVDNHPKTSPLYLYMAYQNIHGPVQAPENYTAMYPHITYAPRQGCLAMISAVDESIGIGVAKLKENGLYENTLIVFTSDNGGPVDHANNFPYRGTKGTDFEGGTRVVAFISGGLIPKDMQGMKRDGLGHVCDWFATFGHLAGYTPDDPKAAAAHLPPPDSIDLWEWMVGPANVPSPRTELCLSGGNQSDRSAALIMAINGSTFKLVRGQQGTSFFPGPHMPNSTDDGSNTSVDCGSGWLFDLSEDPVEHKELSQSPHYSSILNVITQKQFDYDRSYFQSDGSASVDPKAAAAAVHTYHGFWGPWLPNGPVPSPPPAPTPGPNPPSGGTFIKKGTQCLRTASLQRSAVASLGSCDITSKWKIDSTSKIVSIVGVTGVYKYLRHHPPDGTCQQGTAMVIGLEKDTLFTFVNSNNQLESKECKGMCVGDLGNGAVGLDSCSNPNSQGWTMSSSS